MGRLIPFRSAAEPPAGLDRESDAQLVAHARAGLMQAKERLYRRHARMVFGMVHRLLARDRDVDDVVQDVFLAAFANLHQLGDGQAFAGWLGSITVRRVREHLRRRRLRRMLGLEADAPDATEHLVARDAPADVLLELKALYGVIEALPTDVRIALCLRRVEGLTVPEIAAHMGSSPATVKRKIAAGEAALAARAAGGQGQRRASS